MDDSLTFPFDWNQPEIVSVYDDLPLWSAMFGLLLFKHLPMRHGMTVLDLGYGSGFPALELAEQLGPTCTVYGIDPWDAARQRAEVKARVWQVRNVSLLPGDAAALPFPDDMFDLIVSNLGLNNFSDPAAAIRECARVARPGARLALTTNLQGHMHEFYEVYAATLTEMGHADVLPALAAHVDHRATITRVTALFDGADFRPTAVHEETAHMRFLDGTALLRHHFIRQGFLEAWVNLLPPEIVADVLPRLEINLNRYAESHDGLFLTIPMAYMEAERVG